MPFFDLPLVIREDIYDLVFWQSYIYIDVEYASRTSSSRSDWSRCEAYPHRTVPCPTMALTQTSKWLRDEASARLYRNATFDFRGRVENLEQLFNRPQKASGSHRPETSNDRSPHEAENEVVDNEMLRPDLVQLKLFAAKVERVVFRFWKVPFLGRDEQSWIWDASLYETFPKLRELCFDMDIACCSCDYESLMKRVNIANNELQHGFGLYDVSDGEHIYSLALSAPRQLRLWFSIDLMDGCTAYGSTVFHLYPDEEPSFKLQNWFNYETCNEHLIEILEDYGLEDKAEEMRDLIRAYVPDGGEQIDF